MSYSSQTIAQTACKPVIGRNRRSEIQSEGERFTPLCYRKGREASAKKQRRTDEVFSAICFPGWRQI
jgi:hypothetical protein